MKKVSLIVFAVIIFLLTSCSLKQEKTNRPVWTKEQANAWYQKWGWLRGCDFIPSSAINQLEMWQAETFDTSTINRELGWASSIGMNCMRVYLHHVAWKTDSTGFKKRMHEYLDIAGKHGISTIFVFFDDCWNPQYKAGKQPEPKTGIHNSGWVRDPGDLILRDTNLYIVLEKYEKDILREFAQDKRIVLWDLYNEPGNSDLRDKSFPLLKKAFLWGREINPSQPLSAGIWDESLTDFTKYQAENSDVITYHDYDPLEEHLARIERLRQYGKPLICTEYMARKRNSTFATIMPMLRKENIGAINWGLVSGKTNTIYAWDTPVESGAEPDLWFHDIFRSDGTPYRQEEISLIKQLTGK
jgi:hypothetical protein